MAKNERGDWAKNDGVFICDGIGYSVTPLGGTVCIGPVNADGSPREVVSSAPVSVSVAEKGVTKIKSDVTVRDKLPEGILLQPKKRGRPRKIDDDISRMTAWRRKQEEKQGVLPL